MIRKFVALLGAIVMMFAACGDSGGGDGKVDAGSVDSCEGLVGEALDLIQIVLDEFSDLSLEDLQNVDAEPPESLANLEEQGALLEARSDELNCSDAELEAAFNNQVGRLTADGQLAEFFLDSLKEEGNPFSSGD